MSEYKQFEFINIKTNNRIMNTCNPNELSSDYEINNLPYYFNPVFFNKEVFSKYKINKEKYEIDSNYIKEKNEWVLRYYTTNDEEQIFVQLRDLSFIPSKEQDYWKSFNELPSSKMSQDSIKNFILGKWTESNDLTQLKINLRNFPKCTIENEELSVWTEPQIKNQHKLDNLNYVKLNTTIEWEFEIQTLYLNIIDGFNTKTINRIAKKRGCYNKEHKSLKQLENCLTNLKEIPSTEVKQIMEPLFELNKYRSKVISHTTGETYPDENLQINFKRLISNLKISISFLSSIIEHGFFNFEDAD